MTGKLRRHPLAFGITVFGPLPESSCYLMWDGPGSGLYFCAGDPEQAGTMRRRIAHESAGSTYQTVAQAERAANAFAAAGSD